MTTEATVPEREASPTRGPGVARVVGWSAGGIVEEPPPGDLARLLSDPTARVWIDLTDPTHELVSPIAEALCLHPLVAEDVVERNQRAKIETTDGLLHVVMFAVAYAGEIRLTEVDLVLGRGFVLTAHGEEWDPLAALGQRRVPSDHLARGVDHLLYVLVDSIVDAYFPVLDRIEDEIDAIQDEVLDRPTDWTLARLFRLKRELIHLRRAVAPTREVFNQLTDREVPLVSPELVLYFRDVYDHLIRVTEELDNDRELVAGTLDVYLSSINNDLSAIMKRLTGVTVVLAGIGAAAGIFGMSEAGSSIGVGGVAGFWLVAALTVIVGAFALLVLRRIGWV